MSYCDTKIGLSGEIGMVLYFSAKKSAKNSGFYGMFGCYLGALGGTRGNQLLEKMFLSFEYFGRRSIVQDWKKKFSRLRNSNTFCSKYATSMRVGRANLHCNLYINGKCIKQQKKSTVPWGYRYGLWVTGTYLRRYFWAYLGCKDEERDLVQSGAPIWSATSLLHSSNLLTCLFIWKNCMSFKCDEVRLGTRALVKQVWSDVRISYYETKIQEYR